MRLVWTLVSFTLTVRSTAKRHLHSQVNRWKKGDEP